MLGVWASAAVRSARPYFLPAAATVLHLNDFNVTSLRMLFGDMYPTKLIASGSDFLDKMKVLFCLFVTMNCSGSNLTADSFG